MSDSWSETPSEDSVGFASELRELAHAPPVPLEHLREQATLPAGSVVDGTFVVERVLGTGGMGVVYLARHEALDRRVALKLCLRRSSERHNQLLLREARTMAALVHPHVVAVHHVGTAAEQVYIAMEYVPGGTLRSWSAAGRGWPDVLAMFVQAGHGLAAAHAKGFVHRDFKPESGLASQVVENTSVPRLRRWYVPIVYQAQRPRQDRAARVRCERLARSRTCVTGIGARRKESTQQ